MDSAADDLTDAALAADLAADAGKLLLQVREEVGFGHPWALGDAGDFHANGYCCAGCGPSGRVTRCSARRLMTTWSG